MSVDYFLVSPSEKKLVIAGCTKNNVTYGYYSSEELGDFIRWAIDNEIKDVQLMKDSEVEALGLTLFPKRSDAIY